MVKSFSGFASSRFHQAQLQGILWHFDGQNLRCLALILAVSSSSIPRHLGHSESVLMSKIIWFASRGSHQAQFQGILGHSESILMSKIIWFDAGSSHQVQLSGISGYSENISMVDNRLALLLAVYIKCIFKTFLTFWEYSYGHNLPGIAFSCFPQGQLQRILASI